MVSKREIELNAKSREMMKPCAGCVHMVPICGDITKRIYVCNYILDTGKKRPCPSGAECTVKELRKRNIQTVDAEAAIYWWMEE